MKNKLWRDAPLLRLAVPMMVGIVIGDGLMITEGMALMALTVGGIIAVSCWRWPVVQSAAMMLSMALTGVALVILHRQQMAVVWPKGEVNFEAVVLSEPVERPKTMAVDMMMTQSGRKLKCYLYKDSLSRALRVGDGLNIRSLITENSRWRQGTFDYHRYLEVHGFTGTTFVAGWKWRKAQVSLRGLSRIERTRLFFLQLRSRLLRRMNVEGMTGDVYGVVAAMALGDKSGLTAEMKDVYARTGASHVLALSGLHLSMVYVLLSLLTVGRRRMVAQLLTVTGIWAFVLLVGMSVSVVRSAVMISVYALLELGRRDRMSVNTLAFTAIVMLMVNPYALFDVGFQLSYMAVLAILTLLPLADCWVEVRYGMARRLWGLLTVSTAAQIGTAPLTAYYFGRLSLWFVLTNLIVVPATGLILCLSVAVMVCPPLAYLLIYIVGLLNTVLLYLSAIPGASIDGLHPSALQIWMVYVVIVALYLLIVRLTCSRATAGYR